MANNQVELDTVLGLLVAATNSATESMDDGIGITLALSGQVVSGKLIPNWQWFDDMASQLTDYSDELHREDDGERSPGIEVLFAEAHKAVTERAKEMAAARDAAAELAPRYRQAISAEDPVGFLHLKDARVFAPGQAPLPAVGMYWRGRLADVAGWSFGLLQES